ncbi:MAG: 40S ribosomal protein S26, partial [Paramarteilia canceri]
PKKRQNNGRRSNKQRGNVLNARCNQCRALVRKDKAIITISFRPMLESGVRQDYSHAKAPPQVISQKILVRTIHCVSCAKHLKKVTSKSLKTPKSCGLRILYQKNKAKIEERRKKCRVTCAVVATGANERQTNVR